METSQLALVQGKYETIFFTQIVMPIASKFRGESIWAKKFIDDLRGLKLKFEKRGTILWVFLLFDMTHATPKAY